MNIAFDTNSIRQAEARGLIALLSSLIVGAYPPTTQPAPLSHPIPTTEEQAVFGVPIETDQRAVEPIHVVADPVRPSVTAQHPVSEPEQTTVTRHRRTKAQIAADAAYVAAGDTPTDPTPVGSNGLVAGSGVQTVAASGTTGPATVSSGTVPAGEATKPISADDLRSLLNSYIKKHGMDEAIAQLKRFGCNRVTEALALDPVKLNELASALNA